MKWGIDLEEQRKCPKCKKENDTNRTYLAIEDDTLIIKLVSCEFCEYKSYEEN